MNKITVTQGQSLLDISIQYYGTAKAVLEIATNNNLSITDDLYTGQILEMPKPVIYNKFIAEHYYAKMIFPATGVTDEYMENLDNSGIGEMIINVTFKPKAIQWPVQ